MKGQPSLTSEDVWIREFVDVYATDKVTRCVSDGLRGISLTRAFETLAGGFVLSTEGIGPGTACKLLHRSDDNLVEAIVYFDANRMTLEIREARIAEGNESEHMRRDLSYSPVAEKDYSGLLGAPFTVFLSSGVSEHADGDGKAVDIVDLPGLIAAVVQGRVLHPDKLSGEDLKYIRSALRLRSNEIASALDLTLEHYHLCESGAKVLTDEKEKFYRMYAFLTAVFKDKNAEEKPMRGGAFETSLLCLSSAKAQESMLAFGRIFFDMKIRRLYVIGTEKSDLMLRFSRRSSSRHCADDVNWRRESDIAPYGNF